MSTDSISERRKRAAAESIHEVRRALNEVETKYKTKQMLRASLDEEISKPIFISYVKTQLGYAEQMIRFKLQLTETDPMPEDVSDPIERAKERLDELAKVIDQARSYAQDIRKFEIEKSALESHRENLCDDCETAAHKLDGSFSELEGIWEEAFDLAAGICLRHEGLDGGLCQIADLLIEEIGLNKGKAFAIPSRRTVGGKNSKIVHLRFPEWTVWALPLAAHEVWQLRVRDDRLRAATPAQSRLFKSLLEANSGVVFGKAALSLWEKDSCQDVLADVFGVFSLGPAYACACINLMLDPTDPWSAVRAKAILYTLSGVMKYEKSIPRPDHVVEVLTAEWDLERREAKQKSDLDTGQAEATRVLFEERLIDALLIFLEESPTARFDLNMWGAISPALLSALDSGSEKDLPEQTLSIGYLLNAAWRKRLDRSDAPTLEKTAKNVRHFAGLLLRASSTRKARGAF
jgi:hypothetical protein